MKLRNINLITILILFYLVTISRTILLYYAQIYFPDLEYIASLNSISQEFLLYGWIIKILIILIVLSFIPGFIIIKRNLREQNIESEIIPIPIVILFAAMCPVLVVVNNFITGDFLFSMGLLVYGVLFTLAAFKFR